MLAYPQTHTQCPIPGYNGGWDGLSDRIPRIATLLAQHGFKPYYRELHLSLNALPNHGPYALDIPPYLVREKITDAGNFIIRLYEVQNGTETERAICYATPCAHLSDDPQAAMIGYIDWLWVDPTARRRGVARAFMQRMLQILRDHGFQHCWLTTGADNWPAQPLYLAMGFQVVDCSASFIRRRNPLPDASDA
jgi:GNAT superfamily N-acetyltransferase